MPSAKPFFDINKFPKKWGIILFPLSMSRLGNAFSPQACMDALELLSKKIQINRVGAHFLYTEGVYMNFETEAYKTKNNFAKSAVNHMGGVRNLIRTNFQKFQIDAAFSFESWFQMYLSHKNFFHAFKVVCDLYEKNPKFQKYIAEDAKDQNRELTDQQLAFYLEEHTFAYLLFYKELELRNEFVNGREQWILMAYPGKPPKGQIYLVQNNPLNLEETVNPYKGQYDLVAKKFIDYLKVDLENFEY